MGVDGLPWRPMTVSELLDAAVAVLRRRPVRLMAAAVGLAVVEQAVLFPLRAPLTDGQHDYFDDITHLRHHIWTVIAVGMGTEACVIGVLGVVAAGSARASLLSMRDVPPVPGRWFGAVALSLLVGVGAFATFWCGAVPWVFWFMFTGLVTPVLVNDAVVGVPGRPGRRLSVLGAFGRSFGLVGRSGLRPGAIRLLIAYVGLQVLPGFVPVPVALEFVIWVLVNATLYALVAGGDAASHLETRMRLEGLDIELSRALRRGTPVADALVVPR